MSMLTRSDGARAPLRGIRFILSHPGPLLPWLALPLLINILCVIAAFVAAFWGVPSYIESIAPAPANAYFAYAMRVLTYALALIIFVILLMLLYMIAGTLGSPFYDRLSEEVEHIVRGNLPAERPWWINAFWSVLHSAMGGWMWIAVVVLGTFLNAVPAIGTALELAWTLAGSAFLVAREMLDGPLTRRRLTFREKLEFIWRHFGVLGPFGLTSTLLLWVPLLNFIMLPVAVVGGTLLFLDIEDQTGDPPRKPEAMPPELVDTAPPTPQREHRPSDGAS